eukprot:4974593-Amphidinium_carterae.1
MANQKLGKKYEVSHFLSFREMCDREDCMFDSFCALEHKKLKIFVRLRCEARGVALTGGLQPKELMMEFNTNLNPVTMCV